METIRENDLETTTETVSVMNVVEGSGAEKAGLRKGDILKSIAGHQLASVQDLTEAIAPFKPGDVVDVKFVRDGQEQTVKATLGAPTQVEDREKKVVIIKEIEKIVEEDTDKEEIESYEDMELNRSLSLETIRIFPNPNDGLLRIKFEGESGPTTLRLSTIRGKKLYEEKIEDFNGSYNQEINLKRYPKGPILLTIEQKGGIYQEQVIHQ